MLKALTSSKKHKTFLFCLRDQPAAVSTLKLEATCQAHTLLLKIELTHLKSIFEFLEFLSAEAEAAGAAAARVLGERKISTN